MKDDRQRIFRELLSAIISSRLSPRDLREMARLLQSDAPFTQELAQLIVEISGHMEPQQTLRYEQSVGTELPSARQPDALVEGVYQVLARRRWSKSKVLDLFQKISPNVKWYNVSRGSTVKELVSYFMATATEFQKNKLLGNLKMSVEPDEYLGGISKRLER